MQKKKTATDIYQGSHYIPVKRKELNLLEYNYSQFDIFLSFFILHIFIKIFNELGYLSTKNYGCNFLSQFFQWFYEFTTSLWIYFECHSQISLLKLLFMFRLILIELKKMKNKKQGKSSIFFSLRYFHCLNHSFFDGKTCIQDIIPNFDWRHLIGI